MFCKYCGKPLDENFHCASCGRSMTPTRRSNELDELLSSGSSGTEPAQTELNRAREEGYRDGYKEGYSSGEDSARQTMNKRKRVIAVVVLAVFALSVAVAGGVSFNLGKRKGNSDALAALSTSTPSSTAAVMPSISPSATPAPSPTPSLSEAVSPTPSPQVTLTTIAVPSINPDVTPDAELIQLGDENSYVTGIQKCLHELGYKVDVDGVFGYETADAVKEFQSKHDLEETGSVDLWTLCAILSDMAEAQANQVTDTPTAGTSDTTVEAPGATASPVPSEPASLATPTMTTNPTESAER